MRFCEEERGDGRLVRQGVRVQEVGRRRLRTRSLVERHLGADGLERGCELVGLVLCRVLLEGLWQRLDKLLGLPEGIPRVSVTSDDRRGDDAPLRGSFRA